ncbi:MAG TPA: hypothetical protein VJ765_10005 [Chitinophagaceae bacterium]|nr:hypothetical protein [Chitinophagaceae bacterium]
MKNVMSKNKASIIALMAMIGLAFTNPVVANAKTDPPVIEIKYLGVRENNPVFEIIMNNSQTDSFIITIRDEEGTLLFSEKLSGKNMSRQYRIDTEDEIPEGGLRFEVKSVNSKKTEIYMAGTTENVKREMAVNKVQ